MRYALISDVHANVPALEAVLTDIARRPAVAGTYHLGDLVGYGPWPNETVSLLEHAGIPGVAGNCDSTVATEARAGIHAGHAHHATRALTRRAARDSCLLTGTSAAGREGKRSDQSGASKTDHRRLLDPKWCQVSFRPRQEK